MLETPASLSFYGGNLVRINLLDSKLSFLFCFIIIIFFFLTMQAKRLLGADEKQLGVRERLTAGAMAGVASQTSIYPLEVKLFFYHISVS